MRSNSKYITYNRDKWTTVVKEDNILAGKCNHGVCTHICNIPLSCNSMTSPVSTMNSKMDNIT